MAPPCTSAIPTEISSSSCPMAPDPSPAARGKGRGEDAVAVIFDMDGVLIDSGAHHRAAWRALLAEIGEEPDPEHWRLTIGRPSEEAVPLLLGRRLSDYEVRRLARRKRDLYVDFARQGIVTVAGVGRFIADLARQKVPRGVGTSASGHDVYHLLADAGPRSAAWCSRTRSSGWKRPAARACAPSASPPRIQWKSSFTRGWSGPWRTSRKSSGRRSRTRKHARLLGRTVRLEPGRMGTGRARPFPRRPTRRRLPRGPGGPGGRARRGPRSRRAAPRPPRLCGHGLRFRRAGGGGGAAPGHPRGCDGHLRAARRLPSRIGFRPRLRRGVGIHLFLRHRPRSARGVCAGAPRHPQAGRLAPRLLLSDEGRRGRPTLPRLTRRNRGSPRALLRHRRSGTAPRLARAPARSRVDGHGPPSPQLIRAYHAC